MKRMFLGLISMLSIGAMGCASFGFPLAPEQETIQNKIYQECISGCMPVCESLYYSEAVLYPQNANTQTCLDDDRCEQCLSDCKGHAE